MPEHSRFISEQQRPLGHRGHLANRPRHIRLVLDWAFSSEDFGSSLRPDTAAIIGHSLGGYTALATAGGQPTAFAHEMAERQSRRIDVIPHARVKALVLLAPATVWYMEPRALSGVRVPILMLTGEKDRHTPPIHAEIVKRGVADPALVEHRVIANAGHFSFLTPFPEAMTNLVFILSRIPSIRTVPYLDNRLLVPPDSPPPLLVAAVPSWDPRAHARRAGTYPAASVMAIMATAPKAIGNAPVAASPWIRRFPAKRLPHQAITAPIERPAAGQGPAPLQAPCGTPARGVAPKSDADAYFAGAARHRVSQQPVDADSH